MKVIVLFCLAVFFPPTFAQEPCTPEANQRLQSLMSKVTEASKVVDAYNTKYKINSNQQSDIMAFCLKEEARTEFKKVFDQAAPAVNISKPSEMAKPAHAKTRR